MPAEIYGDKLEAAIRVKALYYKYLVEGKTKKEAAKLAQAETGTSAVTGNPIRKKVKYAKRPSKRRKFGQF